MEIEVQIGRDGPMRTDYVVQLVIDGGKYTTNCSAWETLEEARREAERIVCRDTVRTFSREYL